MKQKDTLRNSQWQLKSFEKTPAFPITVKPQCTAAKIKHSIFKTVRREQLAERFSLPECAAVSGTA